MKKIFTTIAAIVFIVSCCSTGIAQEKTLSPTKNKNSMVCKPAKNKKGTVCYTSKYAKNYKVSKMKNNSYACGKMTATSSVAPYSPRTGKTQRHAKSGYSKNVSIAHGRMAINASHRDNEAMPEPDSAIAHVYTFESQSNKQELARNLPYTPKNENTSNLLAPQNQSFKNVNTTVK